MDPGGPSQSWLPAPPPHFTIFPAAPNWAEPPKPSPNQPPFFPSNSLNHWNSSWRPLPLLPSTSPIFPPQQLHKPTTPHQTFHKAKNHIISLIPIYSKNPFCATKHASLHWLCLHLLNPYVFQESLICQNSFLRHNVFDLTFLWF